MLGRRSSPLSSVFDPSLPGGRVLFLLMRPLGERTPAGPKQELPDTLASLTAAPSEIDAPLNYCSISLTYLYQACIRARTAADLATDSSTPSRTI